MEDGDGEQDKERQTAEKDGQSVRDSRVIFKIMEKRQTIRSGAPENHI